MFSLDANKIINELENRWHTKLGIIFLLIIWFVASLVIAEIFSLTINVYIILLALGILIIIISWCLLKNHLPKIKKDKIGFIVAIRCENEATRLKIKEDFIDTLRELLLNGPSGYLFHFISLPERLSR